MGSEGNTYDVDDPGVPNEDGESWQELVERRAGPTHCPSCSAEGDLEDSLAPNQRRCPTPTERCGVVTFLEADS